MKFKVDENLPIEVGEVLRAAGHDAVTVNDEGIGGARDPDIASVLRHENRAIVTLDVGFADIRLYPPREYPGIVVLRLPRQDKAFVLRICERLVGPLAKEPLGRSPVDCRSRPHQGPEWRGVAPGRRTSGCS